MPGTTACSYSLHTEESASDQVLDSSACRRSGTSKPATRFRRIEPVEVDLRVDPFDTPWAQVRDAVRAAVDAGFAGIWTPDHVDGRVFGASQVLECWTTLTAIAVSTSDVKGGPLVLNRPNPP